MIGKDETLSLKTQCRLLGISRSSLYYKPATESPLNVKIMRLIDEQHTKDPVRFGQPKMKPYLLTNYTVLKPNEVWSTDITYIPMRYGYMYLVAIMDWYSRYVISWNISNTLETDFCVETLNRALNMNKPLIFNSDQGSQFTNNQFTCILEKHNIQISMDGKGRSLDNIFIERLWRTVKYEDIYKKSYETVQEL